MKIILAKPRGFCAEVVLAQAEGDVDRLDLSGDIPIGHVTQTALGVDDRRGVIAALFRRFGDVAGPGTEDICYATQNCQTTLLELTKLVDLIFLVDALYRFGAVEPFTLPGQDGNIKFRVPAELLKVAGDNTIG